MSEKIKIHSFPLYDSLKEEVETTGYNYDPINACWRLNTLASMGNSQLETMKIIHQMIIHHALINGVQVNLSKLPYNGVPGKNGIGSTFKTPKVKGQKNALPLELCNIISLYLDKHFEKKNYNSY